MGQFALMSMKNHPASFRFIALAALLIGGAVGAHAATFSVTVTPSPAAPNTLFTGQVWLETGADSLNAVEGTISVPDGLQISSVDSGNSALSLWASSPVFVIKDSLLSFAGGTPKPLPANTRALLFTFTGTATRSGAYAFSPIHLAAYKADGKGTAAGTAFTPSSLKISKDGDTAAAPVSKDAAAPVFVDVSLGSDPSLFDGKYFVSFAATDAGTGVEKYEIQEGMFAPFVRAERYYVVRDQGLSKNITVRAIDAALPKPGEAGPLIQRNRLDGRAYQQDSWAYLSRSWTEMFT
jgi:hypothetical protein